VATNGEEFPVAVAAAKPRSAEVLIAATDLYRFFHIGDEETLALRGVTVEVAAGELVVVLGPSGSGKSTLLACLAGLDEPDGGVVHVEGERMSRRPETVRAALRARHMGILLQSGNLFDHLTVSDNIRLKLRLAGVRERGRVHEVLEQVGIAPRASAYPTELSGGEAERAGLAVALAAKPRVLLADEPTGEVDSATEERILAVFDEHRRSGGASLIVSHSDAVARRADRIIHLRDGRVVDE
jgi:putative ABC transport system ATP-binding protein